MAEAVELLLLVLIILSMSAIVSFFVRTVFRLPARVSLAVGFMGGGITVGSMFADSYGLDIRINSVVVLACLCAVLCGSICGGLFAEQIKLWRSKTGS